MRVKSFQGRTLEEILPEIRSELGPNAVVLSQKQLIAGGIGGFFGTRMLEVVAADRMPSDDELIDLDDRQYATAGARTNSGSPARLRAASAGRERDRHGLDVTDDWDPADDDELAEEFGSVLKRARTGGGAPTGGRGEGVLGLPEARATVARSNASAAHGGDAAIEPGVRSVAPAASGPVVREEETGSYQPLDLPSRSATVRTDDGGSSPQVQARRLAARAHQAISEATREIEDQLAYSRTQRGPSQHPADFLAVAAQQHDRPHVAMAPERSEDGSIVINHTPSRAPNVPPSVAQRVAAPVPSDNGLVQAARLLENTLTGSGVDVEIAHALVSEIVSHRRPFSAQQDMFELARETVAEHIPIVTGWSQLGRQHRMALVGPSGAGKSSCVAKLAEGYSRLSGLRVGVVSILGEREIVNRKELRDDPLLRRPHLDVRFVTSPDQTLATLERMGDMDVVIFDTPASAYHDLDTFRLVCQCLVAARVDDVHAVIPLATSLREAESVVEYFRGTSLNRLIVSKLDESRYAGQLLNYGFRFGLPITYLSDGPHVPEDMRAASAREIAALIVPHKE